MSKEKQIEEIYEVLTRDCDTSCVECKFDRLDLCVPHHKAEALYNAGYRKQSEWISVDERLPEKEGHYLVHTIYDILEVEFYKMWDDDDIDGGYWWELEGRVTHWMPLPEAPKGGAE